MYICSHRRILESNGVQLHHSSHWDGVHLRVWNAVSIVHEVPAISRYLERTIIKVINEKRLNAFIIISHLSLRWLERKMPNGLMLLWRFLETVNLSVNDLVPCIGPARQGSGGWMFGPGGREIHICVPLSPKTRSGGCCAPHTQGCHSVDWSAEQY